MTFGSERLGPLIVAACLVSCSPPPSVLVQIEDPERAAVAADALVVQTSSAAEPTRFELLDPEFPLTFVVTGEAGAAGVVEVSATLLERRIATGRAAVRFAEGAPRSQRLVLRRLCPEALVCDDGEFCNGLERCVDGACQPGNPPCSDALGGCLVQVCVEAERACRVDVAPDLDDGEACTVDLCHDGVVRHEPEADGTACEAGLCLDGRCTP